MSSAQAGVNTTDQVERVSFTNDRCLLLCRLEFRHRSHGLVPGLLFEDPSIKAVY
eukprot:COSAG03_NODE_23852_length_276_cov_1.169492_1_plen_54_part_10